MACAAVEARVVTPDEVRAWVLGAAVMWMSRWWRLPGVSLGVGAAVHSVPGPLELVAVLAPGPSALWALVVTADRDLGPVGAGGNGPLPGWVPGAITVLPLGLLVASVAVSIRFASGVVLAAILAAIGVDPKTALRATTAPAGSGDVLAYVLGFCGTAASLVVFGALSVLYARGFGLFVKAALKVPTAEAIHTGRRAWQRNAATVAQACRGVRKRYVVPGVAAAVLFLFLFFTGASEPAALLLSTYLPCLCAAASRSAFPEAARAA